MKEMWRRLKQAFSSGYTDSIGPNYIPPSRSPSWVVPPPPPPRPPRGHALEELDLRKNNIAVKDAWEKYQIVLKLNRK